MSIIGVKLHNLNLIMKKYAKKVIANERKMQFYVINSQETVSEINVCQQKLCCICSGIWGFFILQYNFCIIFVENSAFRLRIAQEWRQTAENQRFGYEKCTVSIAQRLRMVYASASGSAQCLRNVTILEIGVKWLKINGFTTCLRNAQSKCEILRRIFGTLCCIAC